MGDFARAYAILGAQRATKILGIFARLDKRDRKPHYLAHLPRVEKYLARIWPIRFWPSSRSGMRPTCRKSSGPSASDR